MKLSLYFLFYVAMILELLIFIVERDDAEAKLRDSVNRLAQAQVLRLEAVAPSRITVKNGDVGYGVIAVSGFWDDAERRDIQPVLVGAAPLSSSLARSSAMDSVVVTPDTLRGGFEMKILGTKPGVDTLRFGVVVHRSLDMLDPVNAEALIQRYRHLWIPPDSLIVRSDTLTIVIDVIEQGQKNRARGTQIGG